MASQVDRIVTRQRLTCGALYFLLGQEYRGRTLLDARGCQYVCLLILGASNFFNAAEASLITVGEGRCREVLQLPDVSKRLPQ